jgi:hypothetical protein
LASASRLADTFLSSASAAFTASSRCPMMLALGCRK